MGNGDIIEVSCRCGMNRNHSTAGMWDGFTANR